MCELNIGHSIIARAIMVGLEQAVRDMKRLISDERAGVACHCAPACQRVRLAANCRPRPCRRIILCHVTICLRDRPATPGSPPCGPQGVSPSMSTKGEAFAGLSVALVTPFKNGEVDYDAFREQIEFQIAAGTKCICPVGTTGESPTLSHPEHERVIAFVCETAARAHQGDAGHRLQQHGRGAAADEGGRGGGRRRGAAGGAVLQQADAGRLLSALQGDRRSSRACRSASTTFPAAPARTSSPRRSPGWPSWRT